jgi:hypothetical protein
VRLARRYGEGDGPPLAIGNDAGFCPKAAT